MGKRFSWYSGGRKYKIWLDRFLLSPRIVSDWGVVGKFIGLRDIFDHCPVWLVTGRGDWGPKLFKFNNEWLQNKDFLVFLEREWKEMEFRGRGDFVRK